jgi:hypothetical protein
LSLPFRALRKRGFTVVLIVVFGPNLEASQRFREFALSAIGAMLIGERERIGEAMILDNCRNKRHTPIAWELPGVEVSCPLCKALDEIEELHKQDDLRVSLSELLPEVIEVLKKLSMELLVEV